jgi:colicin import membrane protein
VPKEKAQPRLDTRDIERMRLEEELTKETARVAQQKQRANQANALDSELARVGEAKSRAASGKALALWVDKIKLKVGGNVIAPSGLSGNPEAEFAVSLLPDGGLIDVRLKKSSGNKSLDEAIERAIRKSDPLPRPDDPAVFQRELTLKIRPYPA